VAEEIGHAVSTVEVASWLCLGESLIERLRPGYESAAQLAAQEVEELVRLSAKLQ
jgi:hypothetical protein